MIIFDLSCKLEHPFEGWFHSQSDYDGQLKSGQISCPCCGSNEIRRIPSAVHLVKPASTHESPGTLPEINTQMGILSAFQQLISTIVSNAEDVGKNFAQEARKIHYMVVPPRSIYGEASADDCEALRDEGIEVLCFPILKKQDMN